MKYSAALAFIEGGQNKTTRRVASKLYLAKVDEHSIAVVCHYTAVVTIRDDTYVINDGSWHSQLTSKRIMEYAPVRLNSDKHQWQLWTPTDGISPDNHVTCRARKKWDILTPCQGTGRVMREVTCYARNYNYTTDTYTPCEHGVTGHSHVLGVVNSPCGTCQGTGIVNRGGKRMPYLWDGQPLHIDATGKVIGDAPTHPVAPPHIKRAAKSKSTAAYASSELAPWEAELLASASPAETPSSFTSSNGVLNYLTERLPDARAYVTCPVCQSRDSVLQRVIHLNDVHNWTREAIADWLDTLDLDLRIGALA